MAHPSPTRAATNVAVALLCILATSCSPDAETLQPSTTTNPPPSGTSTEPASTPTPALTANLVPVIVSQHPHDETSWTQGLEFHDGQLLESTGRYQHSTLRLVDIETGKSTELIELPDDLYAEGVTVVDGRAVQITWQDRTVLVTELDALSTRTPARQSDAYQGEGWGLCYNGAELVMSDGSSHLTFRDPETFEPQRRVEVTLDGSPLDELNELECVGDRVWANVWLTTTIVAINATSGEVEAVVDASNLVPPHFENLNDAVLNGIAYNAESDTFWVTGKLWPRLYEVTFEPA